jgi:hypothetical protein
VLDRTGRLEQSTIRPGNLQPQTDTNSRSLRPCNLHQLDALVKTRSGIQRPRTSVREGMRGQFVGLAAVETIRRRFMARNCDRRLETIIPAIADVMMQFMRGTIALQIKLKPRAGPVLHLTITLTTLISNI